MTKRLISTIITMAMILAFIPAFPVQAASTISIGQYVQMGSYYGEPILWRCVDIDENGPLMLADKILTIRAFDAAGNHTYTDGTAQIIDSENNYRTSHGSNLWETSNIRAWLNSSEMAGNVKWLDGCPPTSEKVFGYNAYANEKGFIADGNFAQYERNAIKSVAQRSLLNGLDVAKLSLGGTSVHAYNPSILTVVQNYDTAYYQNVIDKIFLLDVKQLNKVYQNSAILGTNYYIGKPTQMAVNKCDYKDNEISPFNDLDNWTRSPCDASTNPVGVRSVVLGGDVYDRNAAGYPIGVRPAFYINQSSDSFKTGTDGSISNPYKLLDKSSCDVITSTTPVNAIIGVDTITASEANATTSITVNITPSANATWKLYSNLACTTEIADKIMTLYIGVNTAYVKVTAEDGITAKIYTVSVTREIKIGDFVQMGKYYDEPILWRCVDVDENGPLMLSDKILTIKPFDAAGTHKYLDGTTQADTSGFRTNYGSNLWETSNMRSWLNSTATAGNVTWIDGCPPTAANVSSGYNAYATEKGFMADGNFTESERNAIKSVAQKSLLNSVDVTKLKAGGTAIHNYNGTISTVVQNYDAAYYHNVTDKMFLLDVKQVNMVYQNGTTLGTSYYIGQPTQKAVDSSEYKDGANLSAGKNWYSWLRSPNAASRGAFYVRNVYSVGAVSDNYAFDNSLGVRPAFYINLSSENFKTGTDGSVSNPYKFPEITGCDVVSSITPTNATIDTNTITASVVNTITSITVNVTTSANATWKLYSDSAYTTEIADKVMPLAVGVNIAYVKVMAQDGITTKIYKITVTRAENKIIGNDMAIYSGSQRLEAMPQAGGQYNVKVTYGNNSASSNSTYYILTVKSNSRLISVKIVPYTFAPSEVYTFDNVVTLPSSTDSPNLEIKAILWKDINKLSPYSLPLSIFR